MRRAGAAHPNAHLPVMHRVQAEHLTEARSVIKATFS